MHYIVVDGHPLYCTNSSCKTIFLAGLTLYLNADEVAHETYGNPQKEVLDWSKKTYFGRSLADMVRERYADAVVERMDVWNVQKDYLENARNP